MTYFGPTLAAALDFCSTLSVRATVEVPPLSADFLFPSPAGLSLRGASLDFFDLHPLLLSHSDQFRG